MRFELAVRAEGLGKCYKLYRKPSHRLWEWISLGRWRRHDDHWALRGLDFSVSSGETFGIIGLNGAGKSTLLALLAGALSPTCGRLKITGKVSAILHLGAGFEMESTGAENIVHLATIAGASRQRVQAQLAEIAAFADLGEFLDRPVKTYSAGMQLRLAFAVAVWERPDVLVVDEVLAVGDFYFRQKCHRKIQAMIAAGTTVILVSHDYSEISQFCQRALLLERGRAAFIGDAKQAVTRFLMLKHHGDSARDDEAVQPVAAVGEKAIPWPDLKDQLDASACPWHGSDDARITRLAICGSSIRQTRVFEQGETASFFVEILAERLLAVPVLSLMIHDAKGQMVHGVSTYQRIEAIPASLAAGERMRARFDIALGLKYGEYSFDVAVGDIPVAIYQQRQRLAFEAFGAHTRLIGRISDVAVFAVVPRNVSSLVQLTHHGLADLPGTITIQLTQG